MCTWLGRSKRHLTVPGKVPKYIEGMVRVVLATQHMFAVQIVSH